MAPAQGPHVAQGTHRLGRPHDRRLKCKLSRALTSTHTSPCLLSLFLSSLGSLNSHFGSAWGGGGQAGLRQKGRGSVFIGRALRDCLLK